MEKSLFRQWFRVYFRPHFVLYIGVSCSPELIDHRIKTLLQQEILWQFIIRCHSLKLNNLFILLSENSLHLHHFTDELDLLSDQLSS